MKFTRLPKVAFTPDGRSVEMPPEPEFDEWLKLTQRKTDLMSQGMTSTEAAAVIEAETGRGEKWPAD